MVDVVIIVDVTTEIGYVSEVVDQRAEEVFIVVDNGRLKPVNDLDMGIFPFSYCRN